MVKLLVSGSARKRINLFSMESYFCYRALEPWKRNVPVIITIAASQLQIRPSVDTL